MNLPKQDRTLVNRALRAYDRASPEARAEGREWYARARSWCLKLAHETGYDPRTVADVTAALSPRLQWSVNQRLARNFLLGRPIKGVLQNSMLRALRARVGEGVGEGPKVQAFAANLRGNLERVTVDVWVLRALGIESDRINLGEYRRLEQAIRKAAHMRGENPADFQSVLWVDCRGRAC